MLGISTEGSRHPLPPPCPSLPARRRASAGARQGGCRHSRFPPRSALGKQPLRRCDNGGFIKGFGEERGREKSRWWQLWTPSRLSCHCREGTWVPPAPARQLHPGSSCRWRVPGAFPTAWFSGWVSTPLPLHSLSAVGETGAASGSRACAPTGNKIPEKDRSKEPVPPRPTPTAAEILASKHPSRRGQGAPDSSSLADTLSQTLVITRTTFLPKS